MATNFILFMTFFPLEQSKLGGVVVMKHSDLIRKEFPYGIYLFIHSLSQI